MALPPLCRRAERRGLGEVVGQEAGVRHCTIGQGPLPLSRPLPTEGGAGRALLGDGGGPDLGGGQQARAGRAHRKVCWTVHPWLKGVGGGLECREPRAQRANGQICGKAWTWLTEAGAGRILGCLLDCQGVTRRPL